MVRSHDETWHKQHSSVIRGYNDVYIVMFHSHRELNYVGSVRGDPTKTRTSCAVSVLFCLPQMSRSALQFGIPEA